MKRQLTYFFLLLASVSHAQLFIEAESYTNSDGVAVESCADFGLGLNVGWIDNGDWMDYAVYVPDSGLYEISGRVASLNGSSILNFSKQGVNLANVNISATGGWQNWQTFSSTSFSLDSGSYTFRVSTTTGGFNLNWFELSLVSPSDVDQPTAPVLMDTLTDVHSIQMNWSKSSDPSTVVTGYKVFNNGAFLAFTTDTAFLLDKLPPNTTYSLEVKACDLASNQSSAAAVTLSTKPIPWNIMWSDEFNGNSVDTSKWNFQVGGSGWGNGESQYYTNGNNSFVQNGNLVIEARKQNFGSNPFTSSRMNTANKGDFLYGRIEVRAKLPSTGGTWPAIWTLPTVWSYGNWPYCGEIDIMEHRGNYLNYVFGTIHTGAYNHMIGTDKSGGKFFSDVVNTFQTYTLEWYPDRLDWYYDDMIVFTYENEYETFNEWPFDIPHHLLLNIAVGGSLGGTIDYNGVWPQQMIVDYVRMYDFDLGANDTISPSEPSNLVASSMGISVMLDWDIATDNEYVEKYLIYQDSLLIDSISGSFLEIKYLQPLTQYVFGVQAIDFGGNASAIITDTVTTGTVPLVAIPGHFEAEDYLYMEGMQSEQCLDVGGGLNMGYIDEGDWLEYYIDVSAPGTYYLSARLASLWQTITFELLDEQNNVLTTINSATTGGWQNWQTRVSTSFSLDSGLQRIRIRSLSNEYNINAFAITNDASGYPFDLEENNLREVVVYPNPFDGDHLNVELHGYSGNVTLIMRTVNGKELVQQKHQISEGNLELSNLGLANGVYLMELRGEDLFKTYKVKVIR